MLSVSTRTTHTQAVWKQRLWAEPDMKIVSSGIPNYLAEASTARFCLHTEVCPEA